MTARRSGKALRARALRGATIALPVLLMLHPGISDAIDVPPPGGMSDSRLTLDVSLDSTSLHNSSLDVNATLAPFGGIYDSGFRIRLSVGRSWYDYLANDSPRSIGSGKGTETNILAGYGVAMRRVSLIGLVGVASSDSADEGVRRSNRGAKTAVSIYATPGDRSMACASFSHAAIQSVSQFQAKVGAKLWGDLFIGPETNLTWRRGDPWNTHVSIGRVSVYLSSMRIGLWSLSVSGGWVRDRDLGSGRYLSLGAYGSF